MKLNDKIYIAGHTGMVGSAISRKLQDRGFKNIITRTHQELDLTIQASVREFFQKERPDFVILAAAKVGGIHANNTYPVDFIYQNMMIEFNVIHAAYQNNVRRLLFLGSTCIYPRAVKQPMREDALLTDVLEPTNEPYAIAKIAGIKLCESYNRQFNTDYRSVMPTNLYGVNDNFDPVNSHVIPALIQRFHKAKTNNEAKVLVWGSGQVMRDFLYVDDMAEASIFVLEIDKEKYKSNTLPMSSHINIGTSKGITINKLAQTIKKVIGYKGKVVFDDSMPDGAPKKIIDITRIENMGWRPKVDLKDGLCKTYKWFVENN